MNLHSFLNTMAHFGKPKHYSTVYKFSYLLKMKKYFVSKVGWLKFYAMLLSLRGKKSSS